MQPFPLPLRQLDEIRDGLGRFLFKKPADKLPLVGVEYGVRSWLT
jgi:hypothetical protein